MLDTRIQSFCIWSFCTAWKIQRAFLPYSQRYHKTQKIDNQFRKRTRTYGIFEAEGADGVIRLHGLTDAKFGAVSTGVRPCEGQVQWLLKKLIEDGHSYAKHKQRALNGVATNYVVLYWVNSFSLLH